jgi:Bacterial pre-peptidase C-terminal domain
VSYGLGIEVATPPPSACQNDRFDVFTASDDEVRRTYTNNDDIDTDTDPNTFVRPVELSRPELLPELRICANDVDWFSLPTTAGDTITITVTYAHSFGRDIDLRVFGPDGSDADMQIDPIPCPNCAGTDGTEAVTFTAAAGTHFIEVFGFQGSDNSYTLDVR